MNRRNDLSAATEGTPFSCGASLDPRPSTRVLSRRRRFTLAEVLVALLVTAVVIPVALRALLTVGALGEAAAYRRQAADLADLKLREVVATAAWSDADTSGDFAADYPGYTWELATDTWTEGEISLRRLDLTVRGPARAGQTAITLTTLVPEAEE
jgi:Tfp pilus assembly protein PilV